ncbi:MAG: Ig-like domain-containing protein [Oscillospiraceae bacterium]|nr:Ig-like domain-containing protein [Oscillospiraceae bacterium]
MKNLYIATLFLAAVFALNLFALPVSSQTRLRLNRTSGTISVGDVRQIRAQTNSKKPITWTTSDKNVVLVNRQGQIKAVSAGRAVITARVDGVTARCRITVRKPVIKTEPKNPVGDLSEVILIRRYIVPEGFVVYDYSYLISDEGIVKLIDSFGFFYEHVYEHNYSSDIISNANNILHDEKVPVLAKIELPNNISEKINAIRGVEFELVYTPFYDENDRLENDTPRIYYYCLVNGDFVLLHEKYEARNSNEDALYLRDIIDELLENVPTFWEWQNSLLDFSIRE